MKNYIAAYFCVPSFFVLVSGVCDMQRWSDISSVYGRSMDTLVGPKKRWKCSMQTRNLGLIWLTLDARTSREAETVARKYALGFKVPLAVRCMQEDESVPMHQRKIISFRTGDSL